VKYLRNFDEQAYFVNLPLRFYLQRRILFVQSSVPAGFRCLSAVDLDITLALLVLSLPRWFRRQHSGLSPLVEEKETRVIPCWFHSFTDRISEYLGGSGEGVVRKHAHVVSAHGHRNGRLAGGVGESDDWQ